MCIECLLPFPLELVSTHSEREQFLGQLVLELGESPPARPDELELPFDEGHGRFDDPGPLPVARALSPLIAQRGARLFRLRKGDELLEREPEQVAQADQLLQTRDVRLGVEAVSAFRPGRRGSEQAELLVVT